MIFSKFVATGISELGRSQKLGIGNQELEIRNQESVISF